MQSRDYYSESSEKVVQMFTNMLTEHVYLNVHGKLI